MGNKYKKTRAFLLACVMAAGLTGILTGCGKNTDAGEDGATGYAVSEEAVSGVSFQAEYEDFLQEKNSLIYLDALDGSYMQSLAVKANPDAVDWKEILMNSGISNSEEFQMALGLELTDWQEAQFGGARLEYLTLPGDDCYTIGILYHEEAEFGILLWGNYEEEILLKTAGNIKADAKGMSMELGGVMPRLTFSDGGLSASSYDVLFFETQGQLESYMQEHTKGAEKKDLLKGQAMTFAGLEMTALGYRLDGEGKLVTAGGAQGMSHAEGIVILPEKKGCLLLRLSQKKASGELQDLIKEMAGMEKYFRLTAQQ